MVGRIDDGQLALVLAHHSLGHHPGSALEAGDGTVTEEDERDRLPAVVDEHDPGPAAHAGARKKGGGRPASTTVPGTQPIASLRWRTRARVAGRVKTIRVQPLSEVPTIECVVADDSGEAITFVFLGRRSIAGLRSGTQMVAEGMVGKHKGKLAMINPSYEVLSSGPGDGDA